MVGDLDEYVQASAGSLEFGDLGRDAGAFLDEALYEVGSRCWASMAARSGSIERLVRPAA